ncbi:hypothetical protein, partial [Anoxybacillus flavithermus]|uniref:hypothetical protein n=1 Tax=Anoxybacillus flavithermus TaxID=33934 RepID=UPI0013E2D559
EQVDTVGKKVSTQLQNTQHSIAQDDGLSQRQKFATINEKEQKTKYDEKTHQQHPSKAVPKTKQTQQTNNTEKNPDNDVT